MIKELKILFLTPFIYICLLSLNLKAQKLPQIQEKGVMLPKNFKVDGTNKEWKNEFVAFNKSLGVYYTIANDFERLYLIIKAEDAQIIYKIISQGLSFIVKDNLQSVNVSYPAYEYEKRPLFLSLKQRSNGINTQEKLVNDSLKNTFNYKLTENLQKIAVTGITTLKDSLISIYNQEGIRANGRFDDKVNYTLELSIPLKLLGNDKKLNYLIQLNGVPGKVSILQTSKGDRIVYKRNGEDWMLGLATPENYALAYPSSLSGTYTLVK